MIDETLLQQLLSDQSPATSAWEAFLRRFSNLILKVIWQFEKDHDEVMEKYLYICRKLAGNNFAILRKFEPQHGSNSPQFTTWLAAVVHNLCIDAHRAAHGRRQLPQAILRLSEFDRDVFRLYYWKGYSQEEIEQQTANVPERTAAAVADSLERIKHVFLARPVSRYSDPSIIPFDEQNASFGWSEMENDFIEMRQWLERWMDELNDQDRMIIRLWFWEDMTGREIAAAMRISPEQRVYSLLKKAMTRLRERASQTYADQRTRKLSV